MKKLVAGLLTILMLFPLFQGVSRENLVKVETGHGKQRHQTPG